MLSIVLSETIATPKHIVWDVICNTADYPLWNTFMVRCHSSFEPGTPITMRVRVLPFMAMPQKETVRQNRAGEFLEYGIKLPLGMLASTRHHQLTAIDNSTTHYESAFVLSGWLAPLVRLLLSAQLKRGFNDMTRGIAHRSLEVYATPHE